MIQIRKANAEQRPIGMWDDELASPLKAAVLVAASLLIGILSAAFEFGGRL
jgi:hypothetical protein